MKSFLVLLCLFAPCASLPAHQDTIITWRDGRLEGLPAQFQPALFDEDKKILRIGRHEMVFPPVLTALFPEKGGYDLSFSSSWYHDGLADLPPYLSVTITPRGGPTSHNLLFDLNTLHVIWVHVTTRTGPAATISKPLIFSEDQKKSLAEAVQEVNE